MRPIILALFLTACAVDDPTCEAVPTQDIALPAGAAELDPSCLAHWQAVEPGLEPCARMYSLDGLCIVAWDCACAVEAAECLGVEPSPVCAQTTKAPAEAGAKE